MAHRNAFLLVLTLIAAASAGFSQEIDPERYSDLHFRHIGPVGNRVIAVVGVPGDPSTYYAGAASGGIWKSGDGGLSWAPIFDDQPVHAIGSLAVAPSDRNVVYAGTGETFLRSNVSIGNGVWRSTDGGRHWEHRGLDATGRIGRVVVHPKDPDVVYAAALGHAYAPQQERGIYRTRDGGESWERVLFVDESTGASDLVMDPNNPRILVAAMWQVSLTTWNRTSGGPGSGLYLSRDGGDTWKRLEGSELPKGPVGKIGVCMSPADSSKVYALIETSDGGPWAGGDPEKGELWRSDDGGDTWKLASYDRNLAGRSAYYSRCAVSTDDADEVYFLAAPYSRTLDGGKTTQGASFSATAELEAPGWDHHDMWIDPMNADRMIVGHDGGLSISDNRGESWFRVQLPVAQMYHVTVDNQVPYYVYGNRQDGPSFRGASRSLTGGGGGPFGGGIPRGMWHDVGGGESGFATPDPVDPDVIWSTASGIGAVGGIVVRYEESSRQFRQVEVWPESTVGWPASEVKYRFQWTFPLLVSPHDHDTVYVTSQVVHRTTNGGQSWEVVSPDLTTNDPSKQEGSGGITPENVGVEYCCVIYAFDESPAQRGVLWAGTSDGLVQVSRDSGASWTNVTANLPGLPPDGTVRNIDASKWSAGKAYLTVDLHEVGNFEPYVYKTEDFGASWTKITNGVSDSILSYARHVLEDPVRPGLLYLGTENALYVSFDDGEHWQSLQNDLPSTPVYWLVVQEDFDDLVLGTYGRGFWILDDVSPLQQLTPEVADAASHLFAPHAAYRFRPATATMATFDDPSAGEDPPGGAAIDYWLREAPGEDVEVEVEIKDASGETVRKLDGTKKAGLNRLWWDLAGEKSTEMKLRTKPLYADWIALDEDRTRKHTLGRLSVLAPPGTYDVTLRVGDVESTQKLTLLKDPNSKGTEEDIRLQTAMVEELRSDLNDVAAIVNRIEWIRRQLEDVQAVASGLGTNAEAIVSNSEELASTFRAVEEKLIQIRATGTGQDFARWSSMLAERIAYLADSVATADFRPTDQQREVHAVLKERLASYRREYEELIESELPAFNESLSERGLPRIVIGSDAPEG